MLGAGDGEGPGEVGCPVLQGGMEASPLRRHLYRGLKEVWE